MVLQGECQQGMLRYVDRQGNIILHCFYVYVYQVTSCDRIDWSQSAFEPCQPRELLAFVLLELRSQQETMPDLHDQERI